MTWAGVKCSRRTTATGPSPIYSPIGQHVRCQEADAHASQSDEITKLLGGFVVLTKRNEEENGREVGKENKEPQQNQNQ